MSHTNSHIPRNVAEQGRLADTLIEKLQGGNTEQSTATQEATDEELGNGLPSNGDESTGKDSQSTAEQQDPVSDGKDLSQTSNPTPQDGDAEYWKGMAGTWESRYQTLAGKYNKEIEQQKHLFYSAKPEIDQLKAEKEKLESSVQELQLQLESKVTEQGDPDANLDPKIQELLGNLGETYGDDLENIFTRLLQMSGSASSAKVDNLIKQVEEVKTTVESVKTESTATSQKIDNEAKAKAQAEWNKKMDELADLLEKVGVDFRKVDNDPLFHEWLKEKDDTGAQRNDALLTLFRSGDLEGAAGMYVAYVSESGTMRKNLNVEPQVENDGQSLPDLNEQVQVPTKAPLNNELAEEPVKWTSEAISRFYRNCTKGRYSPQEKQRIEAEIFAQLNG